MEISGETFFTFGGLPRFLDKLNAGIGMFLSILSVSSAVCILFFC